MPIWIRRMAGRVNLALFGLLFTVVIVAVLTQPQLIESSSFNVVDIALPLWLFSSYMAFVSMAYSKSGRMWSFAAFLCWIALFSLVKTTAPTASTPDTALDRLAIQLIMLTRILFPLTCFVDTLTSKDEWRE